MTDALFLVEASTKGTEMKDTSTQHWLGAGGSLSVTGEGRHGVAVHRWKAAGREFGEKCSLWKGDMGTSGRLVKYEDKPRSPCLIVLLCVTIVCLSALMKQE